MIHLKSFFLFWISLSFGMGLIAAEPPFSTEDLETAAKLRDSALQGTQAFETVKKLTIEVGQRLPGTEGDRKAIAWAQAAMKAAGLQNVRTQPVTVPVWIRAKAEVHITAPHPQTLVATSLGMVVGTPPEGLEAEVVGFPTLEALVRAPEELVRGKIVYLDRKHIASMDGSGYGATVPIRGSGPSEAALKGAVAVLIRSVGTTNNRLAHTGFVRYYKNVKKIPAAALSTPDADMLQHQLQLGKPVRVSFNMPNRFEGTAQSANVIGEVVGSEMPEEIVLLAAHLDSWDLGTGAVDDGTGCAIILETAKIINQLPQKPRRTIRVVMFAAEEIGILGGKVYAEAYKDTLDKHVIGSESDFGAGRVYAFSFATGKEAQPAMKRLAELLVPLDIRLSSAGTYGGADLRYLKPHGVPLVDLKQDGMHYFDIHQTANDTLDKIKPADLDQNVAAWLVFAYLSAQYEGSFGRYEWPPLPPVK